MLKEILNVKSVVTDNARNMSCMRANLEADSDDIITYGYSAHILNLLAHDLSKDFDNVTQRVLHVIKYFRNHHLPKAWYTAAKGSALYA